MLSCSPRRGSNDQKVRIIVHKDGAVAWHALRASSEDGTLRETIAALLRNLPNSRWPRPLATVALGPYACHVKLLRGLLPPVRNPRVIAKVVSENAQRFFLRPGYSNVFTGINMLSPDTGVAAIMDRAVVEEIYAGCAAAGIRIDAIVPTSIATGCVRDVEAYSPRSR